MVHLLIWLSVIFDAARMNWIRTTIHRLLKLHRSLMLALNLLQTEHFKCLTIFPASEIVSQSSHDTVGCLQSKSVRHFLNVLYIATRFQADLSSESPIFILNCPMKGFTLHSVVSLVLTSDWLLNRVLTISHFGQTRWLTDNWKFQTNKLLHKKWLMTVIFSTA